NLLHVVPPGFPKFVPKSGFSQFPVRFGLCYLPFTRCGQTKEVLALVRSLRDAYPTSFLHSFQGPRQCSTVHDETFTQPLLIHLAHCSQSREQSELCDLEARLLQFLVINPRYDPRCAAKVLASTRHVKEHCGSRIRYMRCHNICIYIYKMNVKPILCLYGGG